MNASLKNAGRWIAIADRDLAAAVMLVENAPDIAAFHLQQATEKYLKAFLTLHGQALRKSHDVSALLLRCIAVDGSFASLASAGDPSEMTAFATKYRYPNDEEQEFRRRMKLPRHKVCERKLKCLSKTNLLNLRACCP